MLKIICIYGVRFLDNIFIKIRDGIISLFFYISIIKSWDVINIFFFDRKGEFC